MIFENQFNRILSELKQEFPTMTIVQNTYTYGKPGNLWFAYTFNKDEQEINRFSKSPLILPGMHDDIYTTDCDYDEAYEFFYNQIASNEEKQ